MQTTDETSKIIFLLRNIQFLIFQNSVYELYHSESFILDHNVTSVNLSNKHASVYLLSKNFSFFLSSTNRLLEASVFRFDIKLNKIKIEAIQNSWISIMYVCTWRHRLAASSAARPVKSDTGGHTSPLIMDDCVRCLARERREIVGLGPNQTIDTRIETFKTTDGTSPNDVAQSDVGFNSKKA